RWQPRPGLPEPSTRLPAQALSGKFCAIGGRLPGGAPQREVFEYDPAAGSWRSRAPMPTARSGAASAVLAGRILVFGGEGAGGEARAEVEEFDPAANVWRSLAPMPNARRGLAGAALGAQAHLLAGSSAAGSFATHDVFFLRSSPGFSSSGVVSAASFQPGLAPGSIASIFAANLSSSEGVAQALPLPRNIGGFEVRIDGEPAPLYFASAAQANVLIPLTASGAIQIVASDSGLAGPPVDVELSPVAPAVFTLEQTGQGQAAALISGTGQVAGPGGRPVRRGEALEIYLSGLGAVVNPPQPGAAGPVSPLARTLKLPRVLLGGAPAEVLFSGLAPGLAGVYQVNAVVSPSTPSGAQVELLLEMDGVPSQPGVSIAVEQSP
ncbi:MAG: hypothetical protein KDC27_13115, partial [Acidobacteria bacterium]|nr:hypothetical protein [Acidobacteriota bacterium]